MIRTNYLLAIMDASDENYSRDIGVVWIILGTFYVIMALAIFTTFMDRFNYPRVRNYIAGMLLAIFWLPVTLIALFIDLIRKRIDRHKIKREKLWSSMKRPHGEVKMDNGYTLEEALKVMESAKGWHPLIEKAFKLLEGTTITVAQVKEKFGGLRIYTNPAADERYREIMEELWTIEIDSTKICMICGEPGEIRDLPWILALCEGHYGEYKRKYKIV